MNIAELLERRRHGWIELERMCDSLSRPHFQFLKSGDQIARFSSLYRAACTDLSLAEHYKLPPATVEYLHRLVGTAHGLLYRRERVPVQKVAQYLFRVVPHAVFRDPCVAVAAFIFFGTFTLSAILAFSHDTFPTFANQVLGQTQIETLENSFEKPLGENMGHYLSRSGFYIQHNTGIGLQCYAMGALLLPALCILAYNGTVLGASFGYMARPDIASGDNFFQFVTAHGVFELTAIALSAAAGLRVGIGLFSTGGLSRSESFRLNAERSLPIVAACVMLFVLAAFTEGCLSPTAIPYLFKTIFAIFSSALLMGYFVLLGYPTSDRLRELEQIESNPWRRSRHAIG